MRQLMPVYVAAVMGVATAAGSLALDTPRDALAARPAAPAATCQDRDGDGYGLGCARGPDCNDQDPSVHPGQPELCNGRDDDCSGQVDDAPGCAAPALDPSHASVPAGRFLMGSAPDQGTADERPRHAVQVGAFSLDRHEVTNARYRACVQAGACKPPVLPSSHRRSDYFDNAAYADYPVVFVDWERANAFCAWAGGRLPTEAEWEMAARGPEPSARTFPWGDAPADCTRANMGGPGSCVGDTDRVGRRPEGRSPFGVDDMAGNVWEWVSDWYDAKYYEKSPAADPKGPEKGTLKVMRGGCWLSTGDSLRVSCRKAELPATYGYNVGLRCAYPAAAQEGR